MGQFQEAEANDTFIRLVTFKKHVKANKIRRSAFIKNAFKEPTNQRATWKAELSGLLKSVLDENSLKERGEKRAVEQKSNAATPDHMKKELSFEGVMYVKVSAVRQWTQFAANIMATPNAAEPAHCDLVSNDKSPNELVEDSILDYLQSNIAFKPADKLSELF